MSHAIGGQVPTAALHSLELFATRKDSELRMACLKRQFRPRKAQRVPGARGRSCAFHLQRARTPHTRRASSPRVPAALATMADVAAKREAAIAKKEAERAEKNKAIAAEKKAKQAEREEGKAKAAAAADEEAKKKEEVAKKREANVAAKEKERGGKGGAKKTSKYSKKDVFELKAVFDEYDVDRSGKVTLDEFTAALKKKKEASKPRPGEKSTLAQRQSQEGVSILDLSEGIFHEMDTDGDGDVSFAELLKLMFKFARPDEIELMLTWVAPEPEPEPEPKAELSAEAKQMINSIFKLYDKDKSGALSVQELKKALEKTGIDVEEIADMFKEYDEDGNGEISRTEFAKLMESTGAFDEV